jgi:DNA-binding CsgD family transcriptional regulator
MGERDVAERESELRAGRAVLDRARSGAGGMLLIEGPAGIGKTTVLRALADEADGLEVFRADGDELGRSLAYGVVRGLFERRFSRDGQLRERAFRGAAGTAEFVFGARGVGARSPGEVRYALTWLVSNLADERPVALVVDDLAWADAASLGWLGHLLRRIPDLAVAVLATWRVGEPESDEDLLDRLRGDRATTVVRPAPLSSGAVARVVRGWLGESAGDIVCDACARATGGNPFLLVELLRSMTAGGDIAADAVDAVRPESVDRSVHRRLAVLGDHAKAAAKACAVLGDAGEMRHVEALAGLDRLEAVAALDALTSAQILAPGRPLAFVHPLVRHAVYAGMAGHARGEMHARAARILAVEGADEATVAAHLVAAPPTASDWTSGVLQRVGEAALKRGATTEAAVLLQRALAEPPPHEARPAIEHALGTSLLRTNDPRGERHLEWVIETAKDPVDRARALKEVMGFRAFTRRMVDPNVLRRARDELGPACRELALELDAAAIATGLFFTTNPADAAQRLGQLSTELHGATDGERLVLASLAIWMIMQPDTSGADCASVAERAFGDGTGVSERPESMALMALAQLLAYLDRVDLARRATDAGIAAARERGDEILFGLWSYQASFRAYVHGDLIEAEAAARAVLATIDALPQAVVETTGFLALTLIDRGALEEAEVLLKRALTGVAGSELNMTDLQGRRAVMHLRLAQRRWAEAAREAERIGERLAALGISGHPNHPWRLAAAVAHTALGNRDLARDLIREQWPRTKSWSMPRLTAATLRAEGIVENDPDRLRTAAEHLTLPSHRLELAQTLLDLGAMLRRRKDRAEAREVLRRALDLADRAGATRIAVLAREEIAASGGSPQRARLTGIESLTPSELRVARMAAAGMGNRDIAQALFVTRKTIEAQLGATYRKLDIHSRNELAGLLEQSAT